MSYTDFGDPGTSGDLSDFFDSSNGTGADLSGLFGGLGNNAFGGGGSDLGSLLSSVGQAFSAGGNTGTGSPLAAADAVQQATDPTGSMAAQQTIAGGQPAAPAPQGQNQQGGGQGQSQNANQFAPQSAVDALKKALSGLAQRQRQNPWQTGGPQSAADRAAGQNSPMLNRAARIPTGQVPPQAPQAPNPADLPSTDAEEAEMVNLGAEGAGGQPEYGWDIPGYAEGESNQPEYGDYKNPRQYPYEYEGESNQQEYGPGYDPRQLPTKRPPPTPTTPPPNDTSASPSLGQLVQRMFGLGPTVPSPAFPQAGDPSTLIPPFGPWAAGKSLLTGGAGGLYDAMRAAPTALPQAKPSDGYRPEDDPRATQDPTNQGPELVGKGNQGATTTAPDTGKPIKTVNPKTGDPVNPKTGDPLPTKKDQPSTVTQDGHGPIARDISGVSTGVPTGLAQLAQMAMPLLMSALSGGFGGGGGRHGFGRGFRGFGGRRGFGHFGGFHPGGRGMWPYHHPGMGWRMHGGHPGGGWLPMSHNQMRDVLGYTGADGQSGSTGIPQLDSILQALGIDTGGQNKGQVGFGRQQGGGGNLNYRDPVRGPWSSDPVMNTLVGAESGGDNGAIGDNGLATGVAQIQTPTWRDFARNTPGASQYVRAADAPPEVQLAVAKTIPFYRWGPRTQAILRQRFGNIPPNMTIGELSNRQGGGGTQTASKPGTTPTGGSATPNPQGNPANVDTTPPYVPTQMGAEAGAQG